MKELLEIIVKNLVDKQDEVQVIERQDGSVLVLELKVAPEDIGKVIGKHGKIAKSIRNVVRAGAIVNSKKVVVEIV